MITEPMRRRDVLNPRFRFRSAVSGMFVSRLWALMYPDNCVKERVR